MKNKLKSLKNHQGFMKYFKNTSWLFGEKILRMVVGLFVGIWVSRYLGPEQFGLFSYAQSFVGLFTAIATLGLNGIVVRELLKDESRTDELIGTVFWLKLMGAFGVLGLLAIAINFTSNASYTNTLVFIIASATIFQSFNVIDFYFQSKVLSKYVVYTNIISLFISSLVKIILILNEASLEYFAMVIVFDSFVLASGFIYFYIKNILSFKITNLIFSKSIAKNLLHNSWPLIISGIVISIYMKIDQIMIKEILNNEAVGQYAAAVRLSEVWYFIPVVISASLFPAIINAKRIDKNLYNQRFQKLYDLMFWLSFPIAIIVTFSADWLVGLLYGIKYNESSMVLVIHIWTGIFVFLGSPTSKWFIAENLQIYSLYRSVIGVISNIILNLILIPKYGINGAAIATLLSSFIASYLFNGLDKTIRINFLFQSKAIFYPFRLLKKGFKNDISI